MGLFDAFPYTNFHRINLDWILKTMSEQGANIGALKSDVASLKKYVDSAVDEAVKTLQSLNIPEEVARQIEDMHRSGELAEIVADEILRDFDRIGGWVPSGDDEADYIADTTRCIASYLVHNINNSCVVPVAAGLRNIDVPFVAVYDQSYNYGAALTPGGSDFVTEDVQNVDGTDYPIAYLDCSSFLTLITKCRLYGADIGEQKNASPYYYAFKNKIAGTDPSVVNYCVEAGSNNTKPYTFNFMDNIYTARMGYIMDNSGNRLKLFARRVSADEIPLFNESVSRNMKTGDILFFSRPDDPDYKGIHHCGYYLKTLADLDAAGEAYGAKFRNIGAGEHPELGYVVHVGSSQSDVNNYTNVIRINTLYDIMYSSAFTKGFVCTPFANALNSSKAMRSNTGLFPTKGNVFVTSHDVPGNSFPDSFGWDNDGNFAVKGLEIDGSVAPGGIDADNIDNGFYSISAARVGASQNFPDWFAGKNYGAFLVQFGRRSANTHGVQLCFRQSNSGGGFWYRAGSASQTVWGDWMEIVAP